MSNGYILSGPPEKPGLCPLEIPKVGSCPESSNHECKMDSKCPLDLKCCEWSCGKKCIIPGKSESYMDISSWECASWLFIWSQILGAQPSCVKLACSASLDLPFSQMAVLHASAIQIHVQWVLANCLIPYTSCKKPDEMTHSYPGMLLQHLIFYGRQIMEHEKQ